MCSARNSPAPDVPVLKLPAAGLPWSVSALCACAGLSSADAVQLTAALEQALGRELPATLAFDYPTLDSLVAFLTEHNATAVGSAAAAAKESPAAAVEAGLQSTGASPQRGLQLEAPSSRTIVAAHSLRLPECRTGGNWSDCSDRCLPLSQFKCRV